MRKREGAATALRLPMLRLTALPALRLPMLRSTALPALRPLALRLPSPQLPALRPTMVRLFLFLMRASSRRDPIVCTHSPFRLARVLRLLPSLAILSPPPSPFLTPPFRLLSASGPPPQAIGEAMEECRLLSELLVASGTDDVASEEAAAEGAGGADGGPGGEAPAPSLRARLVAAVLSLSRARHDAATHRVALAALVEEAARGGADASEAAGGGAEASEAAGEGADASEAADVSARLRSLERRAARERPFAPRDAEANAELAAIAARLGVPVSKHARDKCREGRREGARHGSRAGRADGPAAGEPASALPGGRASPSAAGSASLPGASRPPRASRGSRGASSPASPSSPPSSSAGGSEGSDSDVEVAASPSLAPNDTCPITKKRLEDLDEPVEDHKGVVYERQAVLAWIDAERRRLSKAARRRVDAVPSPVAGAVYQITPEDLKVARRVIRRQTALATEGARNKRANKVKDEVALVV